MLSWLCGQRGSRRAECHALARRSTALQVAERFSSSLPSSLWGFTEIFNLPLQWSGRTCKQRPDHMPSLSELGMCHFSV